jgi:hypothetical protein
MAKFNLNGETTIPLVLSPELPPLKIDVTVSFHADGMDALFFAELFGVVPELPAVMETVMEPEKDRFALLEVD